MKEQYILLEKEHSSESLCDLERDVSEMHNLPKDKEYKKIKNDDLSGFLGGTYKIKIVYVPDKDNGDYVEE